MSARKLASRPYLGSPGLGQAKPIAFGLLGLFLLFLTAGAAAQTVSVPAETPVGAAGLPIHAERCANCHGERGLGDGELAANLPSPPAAHASPEYLRTAVPADIFDTITMGRVEQSMPPFGPASSDPLSDAERWNLVAALYSLGTPVESVEQGQAIFEENCLACHGETGAGDGPEAADLGLSLGDLGAPDYWSGTSSQAVFDFMANGVVVDAHQYDLDEDELWKVVDYVRTFGYEYTDALARFRPLETAIVRGLVTNGSTGEIVSTGAEVQLRAFTQDLQVTLSLTETLQADGSFQFDLTDIPQDWFFRVAVNYDDVDFGSEFNQLTFDQPELELPVTVFDKTTDPSAIGVQQLHVVLTFLDERLQVSELYVVSNGDASVFVGESGQSSQGTFRFAVPSEAEDLFFQRGFGQVDSFIPANEVVATADGWADTFPLRPGPASLTMLVQYSLPYNGGVTFSHPFNYPVQGVNLVLPDAGVSLDETDGWINTGTQTLDTGTFTTYLQNNLAAGSDLTLTLDGRPRQAAVPAGGLIRDNTTELLIGAGAALVVVAISALAIRQWRREPEEAPTREELLQAIADLDDEYEAGEISEADYRRERELLKDELLAVWEDERDGL